MSLNIQECKTLIKNGWTIANRKSITEKIGKSNFDDLVSSIRSSGLNMKELKYDMFERHLKPEIDFTYLGSERIEFEDYKQLDAIKYFISQMKEKEELIKKLPKEVNWNSEKYFIFRLLDSSFACQDANLKILMGTDNKVNTTLKDLLFKMCKPLGRTEIHYRKEGFRTEAYDENADIYRKLFNKINSLKVGDTYEPKTFLWSINKKEGTSIYGGFPDKCVYYEIIYPPKSKLIEYPIDTFLCKNATESIAPRDAQFKILKKQNQGDHIYITMQLI